MASSDTCMWRDCSAVATQTVPLLLPEWVAPDTRLLAGARLQDVRCCDDHARWVRVMTSPEQFAAFEMGRRYERAVSDGE